MSIREALFIALLIVAGGLVVWGVSMFSFPVAVIASGLLIAGMAVLCLTEVAG
jgi:hypothetical protein